MSSNLKNINSFGKTKNKPKLETLDKKNSKAFVIKKPTHIYLNDRFITTIENNLATDKLTVLYLHNNSISKIENLDFAVNLKSLYLQKNKIIKLENLQCLQNLTKLYLAHNEISVVEGLENLKNLKELHIEKQRLNNGDSLCFDMRSILGIAKCLEVLNISHNNISSIACLSPLQCIRQIDISHNKLMDMRDICDTIHNWYYLTEATFTANPVAKQRHYREDIISYTINLSVLDGKEVSEITRTFIKRFEQQKLNRPSYQNIKFSEVPEIAKNYPMPIHKAVSQAILKNARSNIDNAALNTNTTYLPWNALPKSATNIGKKRPVLHRREQKQTSNAINHRTYMFPKF